MRSTSLHEVKNTGSMLRNWAQFGTVAPMTTLEQNWTVCFRAVRFFNGEKPEKFAQGGELLFQPVFT